VADPLDLDAIEHPARELLALCERLGGESNIARVAEHRQTLALVTEVRAVRAELALSRATSDHCARAANTYGEHAATLRSALRALVERDVYAGNDDGEHCPYCGGYRYAAEDAAKYGTDPAPHAPGCAYSAALAALDARGGAAPAETAARGDAP